MTDLLSMWLKKMAAARRRKQNKRAIGRVERDLDLTKREIAEKNETRAHLQHELMLLKAERNSL